ncbi:unnamed protein product [Caenorhabditis sp. 36 PRJEB53466]|nr:unnamed protein product [Caenorhabditis sp. 36 PRJEB53466]
MRSPDPFADDDDSNDSFDTFVVTPSTSRIRSDAIVAQEEDSFDGVSVSEQMTVIENPGCSTVLEEEEHADYDCEEDDNTLDRMLESSGDEEDVSGEYTTPNDALTNLLRSFQELSERKLEVRENEEQEKEGDVSRDVFEGFDESHREPEEAEESPGREERAERIEGPEETDVTMLPVSIPIPGQSRFGPPAKKPRTEPPECAPSTSSNPFAPAPSSAISAADGPVGMVSSNSGEYWNQQKTVEIHGKNYEINSFSDYMKMKVSKLNHQVNSEKSKPSENLTEIFKGYSVFVNGYTDPPALVIRDLMISHGGEYHCYYMHGITSYVIASSIAQAKIDRIREREIFIRADWITESIAAGKPLDYSLFLIYEKGAQEKGHMRQFLSSTARPSDETNGFLDARNPNFIRDYYARSRLHLISTLAQDMKDFVANLKIEGKLTEKCFPQEELDELKGDGNEQGRNTVFHVDLDCFFVSVAVRDREDLKEKEVAITHSKGTISNSMSEVASCSYAARKCGVKNGMLVRDALQKCPQLTLLPYQFEDYVSVSQQIYQILASYTLQLRAVSCDEMYINASALCEEHGIDDPVLLAEHIRKVIREQTRCPASVGIGSSSLLARLATRHAKPDGVYWVNEEKKNAFMLEERVRDLPGLGYQMMDRLIACFGEISTCGQLQQRSERELVQAFGPKHATKIFKQCRGTEEDSEDFWKTQLRKSVSCDINYGIRFTKREELVQLMKAIGSELERKLADSKMSAGSITLKLMVRSADAPLQTAKFMGHGICDTFTKTANLSVATMRGDVLTAESMKLYTKISPKVEDLRGVGVICGKLKSKMRKDMVTAVQQMFGLVKKEEKEAEKGDGQKKKARLRSPEDEDDLNEDKDMRRKASEPIIAAQSRQDPKIRVIPHPRDVRGAKGVFVPGILKLTEVQLRRSIRRLSMEENDDEQAQSLEQNMESSMRKEPTKSAVQALQSLFASLLKAGKLLMYEKLFRKFEEISMDSSKSHTDWFSAFHIMSQTLNDESKNLLEFPIETSGKRVSKCERDGRMDKELQEDPVFEPLELYVPESTGRTN